MTASGDGLNLDFLNNPEPSPKQPEPKGAAQSDKTQPEEFVGFKDPVDEDTGGSIFDEEPEGPIGSLVEIPEAIPNISEGGTEILLRGRTEIQEFTEEFGADSSNVAPPNAATPVTQEFFDSLTAGPPDFEEPRQADTDTLQFDSMTNRSQIAPQSGSSVSNPLGGLFSRELDDLDAEASGSPDMFGDTVVTRSPSQGLPLADVTEAVPLDEDETKAGDSSVHSEPAGIESDSSDHAGMSLSSVNSGESATAVAAPPRTRVTGVAPGGNRLMLIALGGYAIVVSILCVLLLGMLAKARNAGQLESLPDLKPLPPGKIAPVKVDAQLPAGHTLTLGQSQRYGNLRVEPIKVTRGPLRFQHYKDPERNGEVTEPVLKLWLKLTNESQGQSFVPLDGDLMFRRHLNEFGETDLANTFLVQREDKPRRSPVVYIFDHPHESSSFEMAGQHLEHQLQPGESIETYIPSTEEGIDSLTGDLLWRIQLRKGHSPGGYGVTTLVEVAFTTDQIQSEGT